MPLIGHLDGIGSIATAHVPGRMRIGRVHIKEGFRPVGVLDDIKRIPVLDANALQTVHEIRNVRGPVAPVTGWSRARTHGGGTEAGQMVTVGRRRPEASKTA